MKSKNKLQSTPFTCCIIDDQEDNIDVLKYLIQTHYSQSIEFLPDFYTPSDAIQYFKSNPLPHILFIDITIKGQPHFYEVLDYLKLESRQKPIVCIYSAFIEKYVSEILDRYNDALHIKSCNKPPTSHDIKTKMDYLFHHHKLQFNNTYVEQHEIIYIRTTAVKNILEIACENHDLNQIKDLKRYTSSLIRIQAHLNPFSFFCCSNYLLNLQYVRSVDITNRTVLLNSKVLEEKIITNLPINRLRDLSTQLKNYHSR